MKKSMMSVAVTAALLSMSTVQASEFKGAYAGLNVGMNHSKVGGISAPNKAYPAVQGGYNWDLTSNVLLGVEGFVDGHKNSVTGNDAGVDAKLGYTINKFMPYARLGVAATTPGARVHGGLGLEYKFAPSWSVFGEFTADTKNVTTTIPAGVKPATTVTDKQRNTNFAIGVNYYFDKPAVAAAVVAAAVVAAPVVMKKPEPVVAAPVVAAPAPVVAAPVVIAPKVFTLKGTNFATSSAKLMPAATAQMAEVLEYAKNSKENFKVVGHTDSRGSEKKNQVLSAARAASVKAYLVAHGVDAARITSSGVASTQPVGDNKTDAGRAENRRVEVTAVAK